MDRLGLGLHLGAALQDTLATPQDRSCRGLFILGDPTLPGYMIAAASNLTATTNGSGWQVVLNWTASPDASDGHCAYRGTNIESAVGNPLAWVGAGTNTFLDTSIPNGQTNNYVYLVRAARLTATGCGSFTNLSRAVQTTIHVP
jgi:hypothetical protein